MTVRVEIIDGPLPPRCASRADSAGALLTFEGVVRPTEGSRPIEGLDYEAYRPMTDRILERLAAETRDRFALLTIEVEHSRGFVPAGSTSFRLTIAARHRAESLEAAAWFIDRMKQDAPLWKRAVESHGKMGTTQ